MLFWVCFPSNDLSEISRKAVARSFCFPNGLPPSVFFSTKTSPLLRSSQSPRPPWGLLTVLLGVWSHCWRCFSAGSQSGWWWCDAWLFSKMHFFLFYVARLPQRIKFCLIWMGTVWNGDITVCHWKLKSRGDIRQHLPWEFLYLLPFQYSNRASWILNLFALYLLVIKMMNASGPKICIISILWFKNIWIVLVKEMTGSIQLSKSKVKPSWLNL